MVMVVFCEPMEDTCVLSGTGTSWPTKKFAGFVVPDKALSWGSASTVASVVSSSGTALRKSMLREPVSTPERSEVRAWAMVEVVGGVLTRWSPQTPFILAGGGGTMKELS